MKNLLSHIESLLKIHECVIIPGLGGFVVNENSMSYHHYKHEFTLPSKQILFNSLLTYNDGLLAEAIMKEEMFSFSQAMHLIEQEVEVFKSQLVESGSCFLFGNLGYFKVNENKKVNFHFNEEFYQDLSYFGLKPLKCSPVKQEKAVESKRINSAFSWVSAAAILFFMFFSLDSLIDAPKVNKASFMDFSIKKIKEFNEYAEKQEKSIAEISEEYLQEFEDACLLEILESGDIEKYLFSGEFSREEVVIKQEKTYHVIIASLPTRHLAEKYIKEIERDYLEEVFVINKDNRYRVAAKSFVSQTDAESYLKEIRDTYTHHQQAWILKQKIN